MSQTASFLERSHMEVGLNAVADAFSGTVYSDVFNMNAHNKGLFIVHWGVGTTGTITLTAEACDNTTPSNVSAIPFRYRVTVGAAAPGAITAATTSGFTTTAGSNQIIEVEVDAASLLASGYSYVRLKSVEVVDSPLLGGILFLALEPRHAGSTQASIVT